MALTPFNSHCSCGKIRGSNLFINWKKHLGHYKKNFLTLGAPESLKRLTEWKILKCTLARAKGVDEDFQLMRKKSKR